MTVASQRFRTPHKALMDDNSGPNTCFYFMDTAQLLAQWSWYAGREKMSSPPTVRDIPSRARRRRQRRETYNKFLETAHFDFQPHIKTSILYNILFRVQYY